MDDFSGNGLMTINDLSCTFHMPKKCKAKKNDKGEEVAQGLPPGAPRKAFKVDEYECPTNWMHGSSLTSSYFVPIETEHGMWLDFNGNMHHKHHVAILISIQGVNPLDGQSLVEIDQKVSLQQYKNKCPKHDIDFKQDRFCEKCGYKWVPQNYLCTTGTPSPYLWLDGFLAADGVVRQYYFTENEELGVAHQIVGAEKKVYSIGVAFYLSKEPKPQPVVDHNRYGSGIIGGYLGSDLPITSDVWGDNALEDGHKSWVCKSMSPEPKYMVSPQAINSLNTPLRSLKRSRAGGQSVKGAISPRGLQLESLSGHQIMLSDCAETEEKSLDIAAGAKIDQKIYADPQSLDFWQDTPAGVLYINYVPSKKARAIIKKGKKDMTKGGEGFLADLKVGVE
jgi:hypothetical protein